MTSTQPILVDVRDRYSVYRTHDGQTLYTGPGYLGAPVMSGFGFGFAPEQLRLWSSAVVSIAADEGFSLDKARALCGMPGRIEQCPGCPTILDLSAAVLYDDQAWCLPCFEPLREERGLVACDYCRVYIDEDDIRELLDSAYCPQCYNDETFFCERCDERVPNGYAYEHEHNSECSEDCESPMRAFSIDVTDANGGTLTHDTVLRVALEDTVDSYVVDQIRHDVLSWVRTQESARENWIYLDGPLRFADPTYKTAEGVYAKRVRKVVYETTKEYSQFFEKPLSLPADLLASIGTKAREASKPLEFNVMITRDLDNDPEFYANEDSCWWTDYAYSRCTLKSNAGFALLARERGRWGENTTGRTWVIPCEIGEDNRLVPTFAKAQAYMVFNGYGDLEEGVGARLLAHMTGWAVTSRRPTFRTSDANMYINTDDCRVVVPAGLADQRFFAPQGLEQHASLPVPEQHATI